MIVAELSLIPMGTGTSASRYVRAVHQVLKESGLAFIPGPMSTVLEAGSMTELFRVAEKADAALAAVALPAAAAAATPVSTSAPTPALGMGVQPPRRPVPARRP